MNKITQYCRKTFIIRSNTMKLLGIDPGCSTQSIVDYLISNGCVPKDVRVVVSSRLKDGHLLTLQHDNWPNFEGKRHPTSEIVASEFNPDFKVPEEDRYRIPDRVETWRDRPAMF